MVDYTIGRPTFCTFSAVAVLLSALSTIPRLDAQVLYGSIVGTVTDQAGASVPGAKVRIGSRGTTQSREVETDSTGTYTFPPLAPNIYDVVVTRQGFQTFTVRGTDVAAGGTVRVDASLKIGGVDTTVEVAAEAATLQTENGEVHSAINGTTLESIPTPIGRNYQNPLITVPGVMPPVNQHSVAANPARADLQR
jgi:hypothetical protein